MYGSVNEGGFSSKPFHKVRGGKGDWVMKPFQSKSPSPLKWCFKQGPMEIGAWSHHFESQSASIPPPHFETKVWLCHRFHSRLKSQNSEGWKNHNDKAYNVLLIGLRNVILTLTSQNITKSYRDYLIPQMCMLHNCLSLPIPCRERLTCLSHICGVELLTLAKHVGDPGFDS